MKMDKNERIFFVKALCRHLMKNALTLVVQKVMSGVVNIVFSKYLMSSNGGIDFFRVVLK